MSQGAQGAIRYAWYQQVTSFRLAVTAEVAGSSPVVPAMNLKKTNGLWQVTKSRITSRVLTRVCQRSWRLFCCTFFFPARVLTRALKVSSSSPQFPARSQHLRLGYGRAAVIQRFRSELELRCKLDRARTTDLIEGIEAAARPAGAKTAGESLRRVAEASVS